MSAITALDSNILIYVLDGASPFSPAAQKLLERLEKKDGQVYVSAIARTEILHYPYLLSREIGEQAKQMIDNFYFISYVDMSTSIADQAARLSTTAGAKLKNIDSIHLATALHVGATEFWTNDRELAKISIDGLQIKQLSKTAGRGLD